MSYTTCLRAATALRQMNRNLDEFVVLPRLTSASVSSDVFPGNFFKITTKH